VKGRTPGLATNNPLSTSWPGHSASIRAFTPVFDGLWTRVNALFVPVNYVLLAAELRPPSCGNSDTSGVEMWKWSDGAADGGFSVNANGSLWLQQINESWAGDRQKGTMAQESFALP